MTSGQILLTFDEPIDPHSANITGVTIQGSTTTTTDSSLYYTLTYTSRFYVESDRNIRITLSNTDLDALRSRPRVATMVSNTYISIEPRTVTDRASPPNRAQSISNVRVTEFYQDTTAPQVITFSLNLDDNSMTLTFNEPVVLSSFGPDHLTISSNESFTPGVISYNLTGGRIPSTQAIASRSFSFSLAQADVIYLKTTPGIATEHNTYLSALAGLVIDTNYNPSMPLLPIAVSSFNRDTSPPQVDAFDLDMNRGLLIMYFNDVMNASSFNANAINLQSTLASVPVGMESHTIRDTIVVSTGDGFVIYLQLSIADLNNIKQIRRLCESESSCFMTTSASLANDISGHPTFPVPDGLALLVRNFTADDTRPVLISWDLDMDEGRMHMTFDEPVDFLNFSPGELTLQSDLTAAESSFSFSGHAGLIPSDVDASTLLVFQFRPADVEFIKASINLGTNQNNSYLSMTESTITDINGNSVVPVFPRQVASFTPDTTSPSLLWFSFNAYTGVLSLKFDEIVNALTFNALDLTLVNQQSLPRQEYTLTGGTVASLSSTIIRLDMIDSDLASIRAMDLGTSINTTYLSAASSTVQDMNDNPLNPVSLDSPLRALYYANSPILASFEFPTYIFNEGQTAMLRVILNTTATPDVSFTVTTEEGQALGMLYFVFSHNMSIYNIS